MPYLNRLTQILRNNLVQNGNILIGQAGCSDINIKGNFVAFISDSNIIQQQVLDTLFNDVEGYKQKNDWVVFGENKVLICEMKTETTNGYESQLKNGKLLVDFILQKMRLNEDNNNKPTNRIKYKYVLFSKHPSKLVGNKPQGVHNKDLNGMLF